ncbi:MAG: tetratricopeptide repeat protein, partial [Nitrospirae bacterium]|nr:tetratricopeptide repeat protein [Nitrospirota bacterium]
IFRAIASGVFVFLAILMVYFYFKGPTEKQGIVQIPAGKVTEPYEQLTSLNHDSDSTQKVDESIKSIEISPLPGSDVKIDEKKRELWLKAGAMVKAGDYNEVIKLLQEVSEKDNRIFTDIGILFLKTGKYDDAIKYLEKAIEYDSNNFTAIKVLALAYYKTDRLDKSLHNIERGLSIKEDQALQFLHDKIGREHRTQEKFIDESTRHFKVIFDGHENGNISRKVLGILDDAYRFVGKELNYFPDQSITVIIYTEKEFFDTTLAPGWAGGAYDFIGGKIRIPVKGVEGREAELKRVLFHEYVHAVVDSITQRCPLWINEGLAEYFSRDYPKKIGQVVPLNYLENSFIWLGGRVGIAYWESYSAISYLIEKHGPAKMKDLLVSFSKSSDVNQAFRDVLGISYSEFVSSWGKS